MIQARTYARIAARAYNSCCEGARRRVRQYCGRLMEEKMKHNPMAQPAHTSRGVATAAALAATLISSIVSQPLAPALAQGKSAPITIKPLSDTYKKIDTMKTAITMELNGQNNDEKEIAGGMEMSFGFNTPKKQIEARMSGTLLQTLAPSDEFAQMGLKGMGMYSLGKDAYMLMEGKTSMCVRVPSAVMQALNEPIEMLGTGEINKELIARSKAKKLAGRLIGEETVNGIRTRHYALDTTGLKAAAVNTTTDDRYQFTKGDLWVAEDGDYNAKFEVQLPKECARA
jgi:hypothetical protein